MSREKIEERKRGLALLQGLGEATPETPLGSMSGKWSSGEKKDFAWYSIGCYDPTEGTLGTLLGLFCDMLDGVGADYSVDGRRFAGGRTLISCTIFFEPAEMLDDDDLRQIAIDLGLDGTGLLECEAG